MAPTSRIIICRHSQAEHNVDLDYSIPDAPLTPLGRRQSAALPALTQRVQGQVDVVLSSGLKRTLQSTLLGWGPAVKRLGIERVEVMPQLQECNSFPCDTGSSREILEADHEFSGFNFDQLTPEWTSKAGFYAADETTLNARAQWVRQHLRSRNEGTILVVAHGDVIRRITADKSGPSTYPWKNAEVRSYTFDPATVDTDEAFLVLEQSISEGYEPHLTDIPERVPPQQVANGAAVAGGPVLPGLAPSGALSLDNSAVDAASAAKLAEIAQRVQQKASIVQSKTSELHELEARLAAAEAKKAELEAKGVKI